MVKGSTWTAFADYNIYGTGSRPGLHVKEDEVRICLEECEYPEECVGALNPRLGRCALERYKAAKKNGKGKTTDSKIPPGYLTVRQVARYKHRSVEAIRHAVLMGRFPGAKKLNESRTARWVIPEESIG